MKVRDGVVNGRVMIRSASCGPSGDVSGCRGAARATRHPRPRAKTLKTSYFSQRTWDVGRLEWETRTHRADVHELAGANIVGADDERTGVVIEERAELVVVRLLGLESRSGRHLC